MLNLGCGTRMHWGWNNIDRSPYAYLAHHSSIARIMRLVGLLSPDRLNRLLEVDPHIIHWDLRKGIPFEVSTFDAVYSSHFLEHIDRQGAQSVLREIYRVLKPGGIIRVVVPDLQELI